MENIQNSFIKEYFIICENAKTRQLEQGVYYEKHHIKPVSIYGENDDVVNLTAAEHFNAHFLLWQGLKAEYGTSYLATRKMAYAFTMMSRCSNTQSRNKKLTADEYAELRIAFNEATKGIIRSDEAKKKMSNAHLGVSPWNKGLEKELQPKYGKHHTDETRKKIAEANKGFVHTEEARAKMSKTRKDKSWEDLSNKESADRRKKKLSEKMSGEKHFYYGTSRSDEVKQKISETLKKKAKENPLSCEARKKLSESLKEYWRKKKEKHNEVN